MIFLPYVEKFLTSDIRYENSGQYRKIILINSILFFAVFIFLFFGIYNSAVIDNPLVALFDFVAAFVIAAGIIDLRINKNVKRAGDIGIWSLFAFFLMFVYVNQNNNFGLIWTIFFPIFAILIRSKSGIPFILLYYAILFVMAYQNIGIWQGGEWSMVAFVRLVAASMLITYVVYVSEQAREKVDAKNEALLNREKEYNTQLQEYRRQLESKVQKTLTELSEKEKIILRNSQLAEMGNLIGVIAHQLKQPLNSVNLLTFGIKDAYLHGELDKTLLLESGKNINAQVQYMSATIDDFRNFFNPNKSRKQFKIAGTVEKTMRLLIPQLKELGIQVEQHLDDELEIFGHESELQQVLINIVHNAKDALVENGINTPVIKISVKHNEGEQTAVLDIEDNGGGVPDGIKEKIFESYFTTKKELGTGIGLHLVRKIVEESFHGQVGIENRGEGARFSITIPYVKL